MLIVIVTDLPEWGARMLASFDAGGREVYISTIFDMPGGLKQYTYRTR